MTDKVGTELPVRDDAMRRSTVHQWLTMTETNGSGDAWFNPGLRDRSVQVDGTFGGGTIKLQGSNDSSGSNWFDLHDPLGNTLSFTSAGLKQVLEACLYYRPTSSGGTGQSVNIRLFSTGFGKGH